MESWKSRGRKPKTWEAGSQGGEISLLEVTPEGLTKWNNSGPRKTTSARPARLTLRRFGISRDLFLNQIRKLRFVSPRGRQLEYVHSSVLAYVVDRSAFDRALARKAQRANVEIRSTRHVEKVTVGRCGAEVLAREKGEKKNHERIPGRLIVLATGVNFRLNRSLGLGFADEFLNAAQAHLKLSELDCTHCYMGRDVAPTGFAWAVRLSDHLARLGLLTEGLAYPYFHRLVERVPSENPLSPPIEVAYKPIVHRFRGRSFGDRVIAVGEATIHIKATTGGGIYYAMLCAELVAELLPQALREDRCTASFLGQYEKRWKQKIQDELNV